MLKLKRFGRFLCLWLLAVFFIASSSIATVSAAAPTTITVGQTPPPSSAPNVIITSIVGNALPSYIELYNQASAPVNMAGWNVDIVIHDDATGGCADTDATIALPTSWLLSKKYVTLENTSSPQSGSLAAPFFLDPVVLADCVAPKLAAVSIIDGTQATEQSVTIPASEWSSTTLLVAQHKQRSNSPSSTRAVTGVFDTDYKFVTGAVTLNSDPLYLPPADSAGLQILEILPNVRSCSPTETDPTCTDYVKLFNPTTLPINLALYRLRVGAKGAGESVTNTFTWNQSLDPANSELILPPGQYFMLTLRNDGQPLSITDSGNYVWLEDAYGTIIYGPVVQYPDASSSTKVGRAWAFDGSAWRWTTAPQPDAANYFPAIIPLPNDGSSIDILEPCAADQYRNPATNRCKSIVVATSSLTPCAANQERNPDTNRCRSVIAASATLTPCQSGWERNPATNRCRKTVAAVAGAATVAVKDVTAPSIDNTGWFVALLVIGLAVAYAVYEWRQDIKLFGHKAARYVLKSVHKGGSIR